MREKKLRNYIEKKISRKKRQMPEKYELGLNLLGKGVPSQQVHQTQPGQATAARKNSQANSEQKFMCYVLMSLVI